MNPLDGLKILDLTRLLPGAVCTMLLADMGATVIKIEDPHGGDYARWMPPHIDGSSVFFRMNNRAKRSLVLDLKTAEGVAVLKRLARDADVLIESFRPGVMARLGVDYETLKADNPRLIYCALSGWGSDGPWASVSGHDLNYATAAGLVGAMQTPQPLGGQVADIGGALAAVAAINAALLRRERGGGGAFIDIGLAEAGLPFALYNWVEALSLGLGGGMGGLSGGLACYRVYRARDNQAVALAALEEKFWANFCNAIGRADLIEHHQAPDRQRYLIGELSEVFALKTAHEWDEMLRDADCCFTRVMDVGHIDQNPHFKARGLLGIFEDGTPWMRSPIRISDSAPTLQNDAPAYGQHTTQILRESGYSEDEIAQLLRAGIIKAG